MQDLESIKKQLQEEQKNYPYHTLTRCLIDGKLEGIELVESLFKKGLLTPKHDDNTHCMCGEETFNPPQCDVCSTKGLDRVVNNHVKLAKQEFIREIEGKEGSLWEYVYYEVFHLFDNYTAVTMDDVVKCLDKGIKKWKQSVKKRHGIKED